MSTAILSIIKGVQKTPGDTNSAEQGLDSIDLLDPFGFSLDTYEMKLPALKSSAVFADSPLTDGRTLIAGSLGNVIETIRVTLTAGTIVQMAGMLSKLGRFKQDCNDFWDTFGQIEPVYLKHQVVGEPGPRYALLYDIDIAIAPPLDPSEPTRDITIVVEREFGWRGIAPGANPKQWTAYINDTQFNSTYASLLSGGLIQQTINNRREWNAAATALLAQNHVDIPAASIPGDLPALAMISATVSGLSVSMDRLYVSRTTKPDIITDAGAVYPPNYILNAGDYYSLGNDTTTASDTGAPRSTGTATNNRGRVTFATVATDALRFQWTTTARGYFDPNTNRGHYAVFVRARLSAAGTVGLRIVLLASGSSVSYSQSTLTSTGSGGTGNTTYWAVTYLGRFVFPITDERSYQGFDGTGIDQGETAIQLWAERLSGTPELYVSDLIMIPVDECAALLTNSSGISSSSAVFTDTTGYFQRGKTFGFATTSGLDFTQLSGQEITLLPNQKNRLHFFGDAILSGTDLSEIAPQYVIRVDLVPRWSGLRDV